MGGRHLNANHCSTFAEALAEAQKTPSSRQAARPLWDKYRHSRPPHAPPDHPQGEALLRGPLLSTKLCLWGWRPRGAGLRPASATASPSSLGSCTHKAGRRCPALQFPGNSTGRAWMCSGPRKALQGPRGRPGQARRVDQRMDDGGHGDSDRGPKSGFIQRGLRGSLSQGTGARPCGSPLGRPTSSRGLPWGGLEAGAPSAVRTPTSPCPVLCLVPCPSRAWAPSSPGDSNRHRCPQLPVPVPPSVSGGVRPVAISSPGA